MLFCYCFMNSVLLKIAIIALLIAFAIDCYYPILHLNVICDTLSLAITVGVGGLCWHNFEHNM